MFVPFSFFWYLCCAPHRTPSFPTPPNKSQIMPFSEMQMPPSLWNESFTGFFWQNKSPQHGLVFFRHQTFSNVQNESFGRFHFRNVENDPCPGGFCVGKFNWSCFEKNHLRCLHQSRTGWQPAGRFFLLILVKCWIQVCLFKSLCFQGTFRWFFPESSKYIMINGGQGRGRGSCGITVLLDILFSQSTDPRFRWGCFFLFFALGPKCGAQVIWQTWVEQPHTVLFQKSRCASANLCGWMTHFDLRVGIMCCVGIFPCHPLNRCLFSLIILCQWLFFL